jgi:hypothetical protein
MATTGDLTASKETYEAPALIEYGLIVETTFRRSPRHHQDDEDEEGSGFPHRS